MSNNSTDNTQFPSFFSKYGEIFCLPFLSTFNGSEKELLNKIIFFLRQAGCRYWIVKGAYTSPQSGKRECVFLFAKNERALQGFDYFRYLFFSLARLLKLPLLIVKFPDNSVNVISCDSSSGGQSGLQQQVHLDNLEDTDKIISECAGMPCNLENILSSAHSFEGMNGAMMRDMISRKLFSRGEDGPYELLELEEDSALDPEPFIFTKEQEPVVEVIQQCEAGDWPKSPETFFVAKHPMYILTVYRDDRTIIDNVRRQSRLANFIHQADFALAKGTKPESKKEYIVIQNFLNIADDSQLQKLLERTATVLELTKPIKKISLDSGDLFEGSALWIPVPGLRGGCHRDKLSEVIKYFPDNFPYYIESVTDLMNEGAYRSLANTEPKGTPAYEIIDFLNNPHRAFCMPILDEPLSAMENIKAEKSLKRIMESGDFSGCILNKSDKEKKPYPAFLFATQESLSENSFLQILISLCKAYNQEAGLYKSTDGYFFKIPVDLDKKIELMGETPVEYDEEVENLLNSTTDCNFNISDTFTLATFAPVKGFSVLDRKAKFLKTMEDFGENGIARMLGQDVEPSPFTKDSGRLAAKGKENSR